MVDFLFCDDLLRACALLIASLAEAGGLAVPAAGLVMLRNLAGSTGASAATVFSVTSAFARSPAPAIDSHLRALADTMANRAGAEAAAILASARARSLLIKAGYEVPR